MSLPTIPSLKRWWRLAMIAEAAAIALLIATASPWICFPLICGGVLMIALIVPPWLDSLGVLFGADRTWLERAIALLAPWGVGTGASFLAASALAIAIGVAIAFIYLFS